MKNNKKMRKSFIGPDGRLEQFVRFLLVIPYCPRSVTPVLPGNQNYFHGPFSIKRRYHSFLPWGYPLLQTIALISGGNIPFAQRLFRMASEAGAIPKHPMRGPDNTARTMR
jgi:hypothetical protein